MRKTELSKRLSLLLCAVLIAAMALFTTGCTDNEAGTNQGTESPSSSIVSEEGQGEDAQSDGAETEQGGDAQSDSTEEPDADNAEGDSQTGAAVLGEGQTVFTFTVVDGEGNETSFEIHTDKTNVGDALTELELIAGEDSDYGLYVKTVNGITVDYDTDGKYWAFYIDGEFASTGVDSTEITAGSTYTFKVE